MITQNWEPKLFTLIKKGITVKQLQQDITSGIIVGVIALPLAIAFAIASGVSPETGLLTAIIGGFIVSVLGGSRVQIGGPTGAFIVIILSIINKYGVEGLLISTFMAGIILILMGLFRMGSLLKYIPQTLITGFTAAIAIIIFVTQINDFLGLPNSNIPDKFISKIFYYIKYFPESNVHSIQVGIVTILIVCTIPKITKKIPSVFLALVLVTMATSLLGVPVETIGDRFGDIAFRIPKFSFQHMNFEIVVKLLPTAFSIALLAALESLLSAVVADSMIGGHHRSNVELISMGLANLVVSLFGGIPVTGAIARTASNINSGGRTPIAGIVHALTLFIIYIIAMPIVKLVPMAALSGVLIVVAWKMSEAHVFIKTLKINKYETAVLLTTFVLTLVTNLTIAIPAGFILSVILFMKRMADAVEFNPLMCSKADDENIFSEELGFYNKKIKIIEIDGPMFFGSILHLIDLQQQLNKDYKVLILRFRYVPIVDTSALSKLQLLLSDLKCENIEVIFSGINKKLQKKFLRIGLIPESNLHNNIFDALDYSNSLIKE